MDLTHTFTVPATVAETWAAFNDIEDVAGCFPGATVTSVEGHEFKGSCKVKLGPIALVYSGSGTFVERDESAGRFVIEAKGKDKRGNGTAGATVTAVLSEAAPGSTEVAVTTDLAITGKPAQFGRGMIQDVSDKLLGQFVDCLEGKVGSAGATAAAGAAGEAGPTGVDEGPPVSATPTPPPGSATSGVEGADAAEAQNGTGPGAAAAAAGSAGALRGATGRRHAAEDDDALDLGAAVLPVLLRAYGRQIATGAGVVLVLLLLRRLLRR